MNQQNHDYFHTFLILVGLYAVGTFAHDVLRFFLVDPNFCDFAVFYFLSDLLGLGTNFLNISPDELKVLQASSGIPHICYSEPGVALYSPAFYSLVAPLTAFDFNVANLFWFLLNCLALISALLLLMRSFAIEINITNLCVASFFVFTYQPLLENVALGQSNILILFFLALAIHAMMSSRFAQAGIFTACASLIKPQYAFILLFFAIKGFYKPFLLSLAFYIFANLLSAIYVGWEFLFDFYYSGLLNASRLALGAVVWGKNHSLLSALCKLSSGEIIGFLQFLHLALFLCALAFTIYFFRPRSKKDLLPFEFSWILSLVLIFMPLLEEHYLVVLLLPYFLLLSRISSLTKKLNLLFISGFLMVSLKYSLERFDFLQTGFPSIVTNGKLLGTMLTMLTLLLSRRRIRDHVAINPSLGSTHLQDAHSTARRSNF